MVYFDNCKMPKRTMVGIAEWAERGEEKMEPSRSGKDGRRAKQCRRG